MPVTRTPFISITLPAPARICEPVAASTSADSSSRPPLIASRMPLFWIGTGPLPGLTRLSVCPLTSAETRPLLIQVWLPLWTVAWPTVPLPRMVTFAPVVVCPEPSMRSAPPARLIVPVPPRVCVRLPRLSMYRIEELPTSMVPLLKLRPSWMRSDDPAGTMSTTPASVTPDNRLLKLPLAWIRPLPVVPTTPPATVAPLISTLLPASARSCPPPDWATPTLRSSSVPPLRASISPVLA